MTAAALLKKSDGYEYNGSRQDPGNLLHGAGILFQRKVYP